LGAVADGPVVVVTASYPGADAQSVADTVAAPIEQQINGVEAMVRIESESRDDGSYVAYVRFKPNSDPKLVATLVQNRVALAKPMLPEAVQHTGVAVKARAAKESKNRAVIALVDRGDHGWHSLQRFSEAVLKRLSADQAIVKPEVFPGPDGKHVDVQIDPVKCREQGVSVTEMMNTLQAAGSAKIDVGNIDVLKARRVRLSNGGTISLGKIATVELVSGPTAVYRLDLYPAVRISALPPEGKNAESAASRCAELAEAERKSQSQPAGFAVVNLSGQ
jgi:multidrug efflux pump subunit AcrB